jgi:hypothetical protein
MINNLETNLPKSRDLNNLFASLIAGYKKKAE